MTFREVMLFHDYNTSADDSATNIIKVKNILYRNCNNFQLFSGLYIFMLKQWVSCNFIKNKT